MIDNLIKTQGEDGSWRFHPTTEQMKTLGNIGDSVLGTEAISAFKLLKFARITNDQESLHAGLKALMYTGSITKLCLIDRSRRVGIRNAQELHTIPHENGDTALASSQVQHAEFSSFLAKSTDFSTKNVIIFWLKFG